MERTRTTDAQPGTLSPRTAGYVPLPLMRRTILPLLLTAVTAAGCGSASDDESTESMQQQAGAGAGQVSANDVAEVITVRQTITEVCNGERPRSDLLPAVDLAKRITAEGPSDRFESGQTDTPQTMSSVAQDLAKALDDCQAADLADQLRAVATGDLPVQKGTPGY